MNMSSSGFGTGGNGVNCIVAGTGIIISPSSGEGDVTINSTEGPNVMVVDGGCCSTYRCGVNNGAAGAYAFSGGGQCNLANGNYSFIGGGFGNCATACGAVLGGSGNNASAPYSGAFGCNLNACNACTFYVNTLCACDEIYATNGVSFVDGTNQNSAAVLTIGTGCNSSVRCDSNNIACGCYSGAIVGQCNMAASPFSTALGGFNNNVSGAYSGAIGCNLNACNACTFYSNNLCSCNKIDATTCINSALICGTTSICTPTLRATTACVTGLTSGCGVCSDGSGLLTNYRSFLNPYGSFSSSVTQCASAINTTTIMTYDTTDFSSNIGLVGTSCLVACTSGIYNIDFSAQFDRISGGAGNDTVDIWLLKQGINYPSSTGRISVNGNISAAKTLPSWNFFVSLNAGQYVQLAWATTAIGIQMVAFPTSSPHTDSPSIAVTMNRVSEIA